MRSISIPIVNIKRALLYIIYFILLPYVIKAQYTIQDSIAVEKQSKKQRDDTQQKIIGSWYYKNTFSDGVRVENKIDSNRVYVFTNKKATVITIDNGKIKKQTHKYYISSAYGQYSAVVMGRDKDTGDNLILIIYKINNEGFTFSPQYNDHNMVTFIKGRDYKLKRQ